MIIPLNFVIIEVWGRDAETYLNNRLTGQVSNCETFMPNFALSPTGRIEGFYRIVRKNERFIISVETSEPEDSINQLFRFKVTEKIEFKILSNLKLAHLIDEINSDLTSSDSEIVFKAKSLRCDKWGFDIIVEGQLSPPNKHELEAFNNRRIMSNQPLFFQEVPRGTSFVELTCPFFRPKTGICYIGQEVVEKVSAIGKPPAIIVPFIVRSPTKSRGEIHKNSDIVDTHSGKNIGTVLFSKWNCGFARLRGYPQSVGILSSDSIIPIEVKSDQGNCNPNDNSR